jgi:hypothetical protein
MTDTTTITLARRLIQASEAERTDALVWLVMSRDPDHQQAAADALDAATGGLFDVELADLFGVAEISVEAAEDRAGPFSTGSLELLQHVAALRS